MCKTIWLVYLKSNAHAVYSLSLARLVQAYRPMPIVFVCMVVHVDKNAISLRR